MFACCFGLIDCHPEGRTFVYRKSEPKTTMERSLVSVYRKRLLSCDETGTLRTLLLGAAAELDMEFCEAPLGLPGVRELIAERMQGVLVVGRKEIGETALDFLKGVEAVSGAPPLVVVVKNLSEESRTSAYAAGAIQCLSLDEAVESLAPVLKRIVNHLCGDDNCAGSWQLGSGLTFTAPEYVVSNGTVVVQLPEIQGRILESLVSNSNQLVTYQSLIKHAWGGTGLASVNTLHQQVFRLRLVLNKGVASGICCVRGRGYRFASPDLVEFGIRRR